MRDGKFEPHAAPLTDALVEYPFDIAFEVHGPLVQAGVSSPTHQIGVRHRDDVLHVSLGRSSWLDRDFTLVFTDLQQLSQATAATDLLEPGTSVVLASFAPNLGHLTTAANSAVALKLLVDCSGSMGGDSIQAARSALQGIVASLIPADRFSISRFGSTVEHRCKALWTGAPAAKASATRWVQHLEADLGGTEMEEALQSTFALTHQGRADVLLVTDGDVHAIDAVIEAAKSSGHRVFVVGIGSSPSEGLLRRLASATGGACEFVAPGEAVEPAVLRMFHRLRSPVVGSLRIEWPAGFECLEATEPPAFAFDGDSLTFFARLCGAPGDLTAAVRLLGKIEDSGDEMVLAQATPFAMRDAANTLARLAAHARCESAAQSEDTTAELRKTLPALAERYQLVTQDTTFVLVHERATGEQPDEMPELRQVRGMQAAGWGGAGAVGGVDHGVSFSRVMAPAKFTSVPSVWRTSKSAPRKTNPVSVPPSASPTANIVSLGMKVRGPLVGGDTGNLGAEQELSPQSEGLTPAQFAEHLRSTPEPHWPATYQALLKVGLGLDVVEWLEFVVANGADEGSVVSAFVHWMRVNAQGVGGFGPLPSAVFVSRGEEKEFAQRDAISKKLSAVLTGMEAQRWPAAVVGFAQVVS